MTDGHAASSSIYPGMAGGAGGEAGRAELAGGRALAEVADSSRVLVDETLVKSGKIGSQQVLGAIQCGNSAPGLAKFWRKNS